MIFIYSPSASLPSSGRFLWNSPKPSLTLANWNNCVHFHVIICPVLWMLMQQTAVRRLPCTKWISLEATRRNCHKFRQIPRRQFPAGCSQVSSLPVQLSFHGWVQELGTLLWDALCQGQQPNDWSWLKATNNEREVSALPNSGAAKDQPRRDLAESESCKQQKCNPKTPLVYRGVTAWPQHWPTLKTRMPREANAGGAQNRKDE